MKQVDKIIFILLFGALLFVSLNRHAHHPRFEYHSQIFTDKAGYHVYLPDYFYYDMDGQQMPEQVDLKTGTGFRIEKDKIATKYPIGVALFELPFFGAAALYDYMQGDVDFAGYTPAHHHAVNFSGFFYGTLGLLLLFLTAVRFWKLSRAKAYLLLLAVLGCSNLLYYITRDPGMSHLYSFTVFAALQYLLFYVVENQKLNNKQVVLLLVLCSLIVVLRPLNALFILFPLAYILYSYRKRIKPVLQFSVIKGLILGVVLAAIPLMLQMVYNQYAFGGLFADSYANESFSRWGKLNLHTLWFGANNGVFVYIPILFLLFYWVYKNLKEGAYSSLLYLGYFLMISILYAAWWSPTLGCGFGHRGFTEHLAFFAFPFSAVLQKWDKKQLTKAWIAASIVFVLLFLAQYNFDDCWRGDGAWDWSEFFYLFRI